MDILIVTPRAAFWECMKGVFEKYGAALPVFVTGDFNATPDDLCITTMLNYQGSPLVDLSAQSGQTFHAFGKRQDPNCKIDYIFASHHFKILDCEVLKDRVSDHLPMTAVLELPSAN